MILDDFPDDAPGQGNPENMEGMVCPVPLKKRPAAEPNKSQLLELVRTEVTQLIPWQARFTEKHAHSTVGVSGMDIPEAITFLGNLLENGQSATVPMEKLGSTLRFASEDLRNFYLEAAAMRPGGSATQCTTHRLVLAGDLSGRSFVCSPRGLSRKLNKSLNDVAKTQLIPRTQHVGEKPRNNKQPTHTGCVSLASSLDHR